MTKRDPKEQIVWHQDGSFSFAKGLRPAWISAATKMKVAAGEDRRHGLHGDAVITKAAETFINNEIRKTSPEKTAKRLFRNLNTRIKKLREKASLSDLISKFRQHAFGHVGNLLPGDGNYNKAIEATRRRLTRARETLGATFFGDGQMPDQVDVAKYKQKALALLKVERKKKGGDISVIVDDILQHVVHPMIRESKDILAIDSALIGVIGTTTLDIAFEKTKMGKKFNKRVLRIDAKLRQAAVNEEGLSRWLFNNLIGYPIPKKKTTRPKATKRKPSRKA